MIIEYKNNNITNIADWERLVFTTKKAKDWKKGRSAYSLADFIINKNGKQIIRDLLATQINEDFTLNIAHPECLTKFDENGHGREHDLAIIGNTASGKKIVIGVEAKVDESFGGTIASAYHKFKAKELNNINTNGPKRIEELLRFNFKTVKSTDFKLPYQLLFSTAGTLHLDLDADIHIFLILVFNTADYNPKKGKLNQRALLDFLKRTEAIEVSDNVYKTNLDNKELTVIYKEINF